MELPWLWSPDRRMLTKDLFIIASDLPVQLWERHILLKRFLPAAYRGAVSLLAKTPQEFEEKIWNSLDIIKVYTKQPGKEKDYPPVALKKGSTIQDLAEIVHKDFVKNFKYARVTGKSVKFENMRCGLDHVLFDEDIVEFHTK